MHLHFTCTFVPERSLVLLSSSHYVCQSALHVTNEVMSTDIVYKLLIVHINYREFEGLYLFKTIL